MVSSGMASSFRVEPRAGLLLAGEHDLDLLPLGVALVVALVLVVVERRVVPDPVAQRTHFVHRAQRGQQIRGAVGQRAAQPRERLDRLLEPAIRPAPVVPVVADRGQVPAVALGDPVPRRRLPGRRSKCLEFWQGSVPQQRVKRRVVGGQGQGMPRALHRVGQRIRQRHGPADRRLDHLAELGRVGRGQKHPLGPWASVRQARR